MKLNALAVCDPRRVLNTSHVYVGLMNLLGGDQGMKWIVAQILRPQPGDRVLDLGCGPGRLRGYLPSCHYVGLDRHPAYLRRARQCFPHDRFECRDVVHEMETFLDRDFDLIVAFGLLHHLPDPSAAQLLRFCHERLRSGGRLITLDGVRSKQSPAFARFLIALDRGRYVRDQPGYVELAHASFSDVSVYPLEKLLRVPYAHLVLECRK